MFNRAQEAEPATWRLMLGHVRPYRLPLFTGGLLSLVTGVAGLTLPLGVKRLIDDLSEGRTAVPVMVVMTSLVLANVGIGALGTYLLRRTGESVVLTARRSLVSQLVRLRVDAVDRSEPGDLMARVTADTAQLRGVTTDSLVGGTIGGLTLLATLAMMGLVDPVLLGVTVVVLIVSGSVIGLLVSAINRASGRAQESVGIMGAALDRMLGAIRTVKASGAEEHERKRVLRAAVDSWRAGVHAAKWTALAGNIGEFAAQSAFLIVLAAGGARVAAGAIDVGTLIAFLLYAYYLTSPIRQVVQAVTGYHIGAAALVRIRQVERLPVEPDIPVTAPPGPAVPASVAFEQVRFRYRPDLPEVHHGVTFQIPPGGLTALVGPSGAGKTTVLALLERFYEPTAGRVLLDGIDVARWPLAGLRAAIGYVEQDAPVLSGSLRENLLFGSPSSSEDELRGALRSTRLHELVARLPDGLDTQVGHRGTRLSGGERQRVAIARALLRRPRLLLLDEATSQLDAVNEAALRNTIADAARTTTVLVVAHRLSTVTQADRIIVMDAGRVRAVGTHTELVANDPLYAELASTQLLVPTGSEYP